MAAIHAEFPRAVQPRRRPIPRRARPPASLGVTVLKPLNWTVLPSCQRASPHTWSLWGPAALAVCVPNCFTGAARCYRHPLLSPEWPRGGFGERARADRPPLRCRAMLLSASRKTLRLHLCAMLLVGMCGRTRWEGWRPGAGGGLRLGCRMPARRASNDTPSGRSKLPKTVFQPVATARTPRAVRHAHPGQRTGATLGGAARRLASSLLA